jgi:hypothetical protein
VGDDGTGQGETSHGEGIMHASTRGWNASSGWRVQIRRWLRRFALDPARSR